MSRIALSLAAIGVVAVLSACGESESSVPPAAPPPSPAPRAAADPSLCATMKAAASVNAKLTRQGYTTSYAKQYRQLMIAAGC